MKMSDHVNLPEESSICQYETCKNLYQTPVMLICCGESLCEKHIEDLYINSDKSRIKCCFCDEEFDLPPKGLALNKGMEKFLKMNLGKNHLQARTSLDDWNKKLCEYFKISKDPANYIYEYFKSIKNDIDIKREEVKIIIDNYYDELLTEVKDFENKCKSNTEFDSSFSKNSECENKLLDQNKMLNNEMSVFIIDDSRWEKINNEILMNLSDLENKLDDIKTSLLMCQSYKFQSSVFDSHNIADLDIFGKIVVDGCSSKKYDLISCSEDKTIKIWNLETGECSKTLLGHSNWIICIKLLSKDKLISCSHDKTIKIWDIKSANCIKTFTESSYPVYLLKVSDCEFLSGHVNGLINLWNTNSESVNKVLKGHTSYICCLELLSNNQFISCSLDNTIKIWDLLTASCLKTISGHSRSVFFLKVIPNEQQFISCSADKTIRIWDLASSTCNGVLCGHEKDILALELLPNNKLASGSSDKTIKIWDLKNFVCIITLAHHNDYVFSLKLLSSYKLISCSGDKTIKIWNLKNYECLQTLQDHTNSVRFLELLEKS